MHKALFLMTSIAVLLTATAAAAPIALRAPLNADGKEMVKLMHSNPRQHIPSATTVPFPAYPGSYFYQIEPNDHPKKGTMVQLTLVSNDTPEQIRKWYIKRLKDMKYFRDMGVFAPRGFKGTFPSLLRTPHITIHATNPQKLRPTLYEFPQAKAAILLSYFAKSGKRLHR